MATETGVWDLQEVRDKQLASEWSYDSRDPHTLYAWGRNSFGELGLNEGQPSAGGSRSSATQIPGTNWSTSSEGKETGFSLATKVDGTLWSWGYGNQGELGNNKLHDNVSSPTQIPGTTWSTNITTGENFAMATKTDGTLWGWGKNPDGAMGQNNQTKYSSPIQVPGTTWKYVAVSNKATLAVKTDGTLWSWGGGSKGKSGQNSNTNYSSPRQVGYDTNWAAVAGQWYSSFGVKTDGTLWAWGMNSHGQLGQNQAEAQLDAASSPMQIPGTYPTGGTGFTATGGTYHSAIINSAGELFVQGMNDKGQLGLNAPTTSHRSSPTQVPGSYKYVATTSHATGAIKTDGTMWAWGHNEYGQLGQNDVTLRSSPAQVTSLDNFATMGSNRRVFFGLREA